MVPCLLSFTPLPPEPTNKKLNSPEACLYVSVMDNTSSGRGVWRPITCSEDARPPNDVNGGSTKSPHGFLACALPWSKVSKNCEWGRPWWSRGGIFSGTHAPKIAQRREQCNVWVTSCRRTRAPLGISTEREIMLHPAWRERNANGLPLWYFINQRERQEGCIHAPFKKNETNGAAPPQAIAITSTSPAGRSLAAAASWFTNYLKQQMPFFPRWIAYIPTIIVST